MPRKEHKIIDGIEMKECSRCKRWLPLSEYRKDRGKWDGLYGFCKKCAKSKDKGVYEKYKDKKTRTVSEYQKRTGRSSLYKPYNPLYYSSRKSRDKKKIRDTRRRSNLKRANEKFRITEEIMRKIGEKYNWKCAYCGIDCRENYHLDHKLPLSRGGGNDIDNLALSCPKCNWKKGTKTDIEFCGYAV